MLGAYAAGAAITDDDGHSESPPLSRSLNTTVHPNAHRFDDFPTASPEVVTSVVQVIVTPTPVAPPTEAPTPPPVVEQPDERAPAALVAPPPVPEPAPEPPPPPPPPSGGFRYDIAGDIAALFSSVRAQHGLGGVSTNGALSGAAQSYAEYHYEVNGPLNLSHTLDGQPWDRATRAGYSWSYIGEVIASGATSAQGFIDMWLNSPPHRDIMLDGNYVDVGVGCYESGGQAILCVAMFGSPG